jgi:hypothetical protein
VRSLVELHFADDADWEDPAVQTPPTVDASLERARELFPDPRRCGGGDFHGVTGTLAL